MVVSQNTPTTPGGGRVLRHPERETSETVLRHLRQAVNID